MIVARRRGAMTLAQHHPLLSYLMLLTVTVTLMLTWSLSEAITSDVSGPRENSLGRGSKLTSTAAKGVKSDWNGEVVGSSTPHGVKSIGASWTPICRNYSSCPLAKSESGVHQEPVSATAAQRSVVELMRSVSEELSGLRSALQHLRFDSQAVHRQIKRLHRASCAAARRARRRTKWTGSSEQNRQLLDTVQHDEQQLIPVHQVRRHHHYHGVDRCPTGFIYSPTTSTCYLLRSQQVTWDTAHRHCRRLGAQLLTIQSSTEQRQLADLARTNSETAHCDFWIGLKRSRSKKTVGRGSGRHSSWQLTLEDDDGRRQWPTTSNTAVYGHWNTGEPNNAGGNEDCVQAMWMFSWRWNDAPCRSSLACYVCQTSPTR